MADDCMTVVITSAWIYSLGTMLHFFVASWEICKTVLLVYRMYDKNTVHSLTLLCLYDIPPYNVDGWAEKQPAQQMRSHCAACGCEVDNNSRSHHGLLSRLLRCSSVVTLLK